MQFLRSPAAALDRIVHARASLVALFGFAYLEAAFLPMPIEAVTAPYMQMRRDILWLIAAVALGGYVAAALTGYGIGALFYDELGGPMVASFGWQARSGRGRGLHRPLRLLGDDRAGAHAAADPARHDGRRRPRAGAAELPASRWCWPAAPAPSPPRCSCSSSAIGWCAGWCAATTAATRGPTEPHPPR